MSTQPTFAGLVESIGSGRLRARTYWAYGALCLSLAAGMTISVGVLFVTDIWWVQVLNAFMLGFLFVQIGMLGHDCSHGQVFQSKWANRIGGLLCWSLGVGLSEAGWYQKHNAHHKHVNRIDHDPDLSIPFVFSRHQSQGSFAARYIRPYQDALFFILLPLVYFNFVWWSLKGLMQGFSWWRLAEGVLIAAHFLLFFSVPFLALPPPVGVLVLCTLLMFSGYYMGFAFAPNHKGMPVRVATEETAWTDQIILTRNLRPSFFHFLLWGGVSIIK